MPRPKIKTFRAQSIIKTPPKPKIFWTQPLITQCLSIKSMFMDNLKEKGKKSPKINGISNKR